MAQSAPEKRYWTYGRVGFRSIGDMRCEERRAYELSFVRLDDAEESSTPCDKQQSAQCAPATFRELYRSRDGLITTFEDVHGHLTSVASARLC